MRVKVVVVAVNGMTGPTVGPMRSTAADVLHTADIPRFEKQGL